ncbi:hypothetical protein Tco_1340277 [Tanacetum coccineum]
MKWGEYHLPSVSGLKNSSDPVSIRAQNIGRQVIGLYWIAAMLVQRFIYEHCFLKLKPFMRSLRVDSKIPLVGFSGRAFVASRRDAEERIIVNDKYPEQTIVIGKHLPTSFKRKLQDLL